MNPAPNLFSSVQPDLPQTILDALSEARARGMTRIGFIGGEGRMMGTYEYPEDIRTMAYRDWCERLGLETAGLIFTGGQVSVKTGRKHGETIVAKLSSNMPDCFIVATDSLAVGVIQAFTKAGILVPRDVSIISINNQSIAQYISPPLTTYAIDQMALARNALLMLSQSISFNDDITCHTMLSTKLVARESFVPAKH